MNEQFQALPLDDQRAPAAYPLVYLHDASITTDQWLRFVRQRCLAVAGESGLIAIRDCRGIVHALFSYRVDNDMRLRRQLCITDLFVAHLPGSDIDAAVAERARDVSKNSIARRSRSSSRSGLTFWPRVARPCGRCGDVSASRVALSLKLRRCSIVA